MSGRVIQGDCLNVLRTLPDASFDYCWTDPPWGLGHIQKRKVLKTARSSDGDRIGFGGHTYKTEVVSESSYEDSFDDYPGFLKPRLSEVWRLLKPTGSLYLHLSTVWSPYVRVMLDELWGKENWLQTLAWAYDFGARTTKYWPKKHDDILVYVKDPKRYYFDIEKSDRLPYLAPSLVGAEKAERGKTPTSVHWHTVAPTNGPERVGYATQKPIGLIRRWVATSCPTSGTCLDPFAGSGTLGSAAILNDCGFTLIDSNPEAIDAMRRRFSDRTDVEFTVPEDPRKIGLKAGLRQLTVEQLQRVVGYEGEMVFDTFNYEEGRFCPLAIGAGLDKVLTNPTNDLVYQNLVMMGYKVYNTRGIDGSFYTTDRKRDLLVAAREVLAEKLA